MIALSELKANTRVRIDYITEANKEWGYPESSTWEIHNAKSLRENTLPLFAKLGGYRVVNAQVMGAHSTLSSKVDITR